jgi:hypothetical protein
MSEHNIFEKMQFDMTAVTRRWHYRETIECAELSKHVDELLQLQKFAEHTKSVQFELDCLLPLCNMPCEFTKNWWYLLKLHKDQVFQSQTLPDIGRIVRRLLIRWSEDSVLYRLYQYSMPYIKHNRLNFPSLYKISTLDLVHLMQVMLATCLGVHKRADKTPTWEVRRQLVCFFEYMLAYGSHADLYVFCSEQLGLLRLALLEHYMTFIEENMPVEMQLIQTLLQTTYDAFKVHRTVFYITDNFRQSALQNNFLDWSLIAERAHQAVERCNRTCKALPVSRELRPHQLHVRASKRIFDLAMNCERVVNCYLQQQSPFVVQTNKLRKLSLSDVVQVHNVQSRILRHVLPKHIQELQIEQLKDTVHNDGNLARIHTTFMHCCLNCHVTLDCIDKDMRTSLLCTASCSRCNSTDFVCKVSILGCMVQVHNNFYYYCVDCKTSHLWSSTGCEFSVCTLHMNHVKKTAGNSACVICARVCHTMSLDVLDSELGVIHRLRLCNRHYPQQQHLPYIYNLQSFYAIMQLKTMDMCHFIRSS